MAEGLDRFLGSLQRLKQTGDGEWTASCPAAGHGQRRGDIHPSLSINRGNGAGPLLNCHAKCRNEDILAGVGMSWRDFHSPETTTRRKSSPASSRIAATYDYTDDAGVLQYQGVRYEPKNFKQRRPDPDRPGEWIWKLEGLTRVLYRLPELKKAVAAGETIYIVEGEKDVDNLRTIGIAGTCNVCGAGKWKPEYSEVLRGANVIIIPDNDKTGREHATQVYDALRGIAAIVKILPLPGIPDKGDVSDWIAAGGTREQLEDLAATVTTATPAGDSAEPIYTAGDLPTATTAAWGAIKLKNTPPFMFRYGGVAVRLGADATDRPMFDVLTGDKMRHVVARVAPWKTRRLDKKTGAMVERDVPPPTAETQR